MNKRGTVKDDSCKRSSGGDRYETFMRAVAATASKDALVVFTVPGGAPVDISKGDAASIAVCTRRRVYGWERQGAAREDRGERLSGGERYEALMGRAGCGWHDATLNAFERLTTLVASAVV